MRGFVTLLIPLLMVACDDTEFGGGEPATAVDCDASGDWCGAQAVFEAHCIACHSAGGSAGGLDLESDPWATIVDVPSAGSPGATLVVPSDPEGSLLFRKARGTQGADEGDVMPPGEGLSTRELALLWEWIEADATDTCEGDADSGNGS
jgi:mono/diheme cytochrome c family protein